MSLPTNADRVRRARLAAGLSQGAAAELAGLSQRDVSIIERADELAPRIENAVLRFQVDGLQRRRDAAASVAHLNPTTKEAA